MTPTHIAYKVTVDDHVEALKAHRRKSTAYRGLTIMFFIMMPVVALGVWVEVAKDPQKIGAYWPTLLFFAMFYVLFFSSLLPRWQYSKIPAEKMQCTAEVTEDELEIVSATTQSRLKWEGFLKLLETKNLFLAYQQPNLFNVIPKRAFTPEQLVEFRELLARKIPQKK